MGRGECSCNPVRFFVLFSMQRSGSGWFETLLNSHPNISSHGEIFSVKERRINISSIIRTLDGVYNLDWFSSASKNECVAAVGFKWMLNQVNLLLFSFMYARVHFFARTEVAYSSSVTIYAIGFCGLLNLILCLGMKWVVKILLNILKLKCNWLRTKRVQPQFSLHAWYLLEVYCGIRIFSSNIPISMSGVYLHWLLVVNLEG